MKKIAGKKTRRASGSTANNAGSTARGLRRVTLRNERRTDGSWLNLWAHLDEEGCLHIDGQDLGPVTRSVSSDGEYEYFMTIAAADVPRLVELLGGGPGEDILGLLRRKWTCEKSYELEDLLRKSGIRTALTTYGG